MKLRILVYGLLLLLASFLTALYLVYTNQDRLLEAAQFKLAAMAREKWGLTLGMKNSQLNLYRNSVVFRNISLDTQDRSVRLVIGKMELVYSLARLLEGKVYFNRVIVETPALEILTPPEGSGDLSRILRTDLLFPVLAIAERVDVEQGTLRILTPQGEERLRADDLGMQLRVTGGDITARAWAQRIRVSAGPYRDTYRQAFLRGTLNRDGLEFSRLDLVNDVGGLKASGRLDAAGKLDAEFAVSGSLERLRPLLPELIPLAGAVEGKGRFTLAQSEWSLSGRVVVKGLAVAGEPIPDGTAEVSLGPTACAFTGILMPVAPRGNLRGRCDLDWSGPVFRWGFTALVAEVPPAAVGYVQKHFSPRSTAPLGPLSGSLRFRYPAGDARTGWSLALDLGGQARPYFGEDQARVSGSVDSSGSEVLALRNFTLTAGPLTASGAGSYSPGAGVSLALISETSDLEHSLAPFGVGRVGGRAGFAGDVSGGEDSLRIAGGLSGGPVTVRGISFDRIAGRVGYRDGILEAEDVTLFRGGGRVALAGTYPLGGGPFNISLGLDRVRAADGLRLAGQDMALEGVVSGEIRATGSPGAVSGSGRLAAPLLTVRGQAVRDVGADFAFTPSRVELRKVEGTWKGGRSTFQGGWNPGGQLAGRLNGSLPALEELLPGGFARGELEYQGKLSGPWDAPDFSGTVVWKNGSLRGMAIPELTLEVTKQAARVRAAGRLLGRYPLDLEMDLEQPALLTARLSFEALDPRPLLEPLGIPRGAEMARALEPYPVIISGKLAVNVPLDRPQEFTGSLDLPAGEATLGPQRARLRTAGPITFNRDGVKLAKLALDGERYRLTVEGNVTGGVLALAVGGSLDLGFLAGRFAQLPRIDLRPELSVRVGGTLQNPEVSGTARLQGGSLGIRGLPRDLEGLAAELDFDGRTVRLRESSFRFAGRPFKADGTLILGEGMLKLGVTGALPLSALERTLPGVKEYSGEAEVELGVSGVFPDMSYRARVAVREGTLRLVDLQTPFRDITLKLALDNEYLRIEECSATLSGGRVTAKGYLVWPWGQEPDEVNLDLAVDKAYISLPGTLKLLLSAEANFKGTPAEYLLKGQVILHRGKYYRDMSPRPVMVTFGPGPENPLGRAITSHPILARIRMGLHLLGEEGFWIDNNVAQVNTGLDLRLSGTPTEPVLSGQVRVQKGSIFYLGKKFDLDEATMIFPERYPPEPYFNVQARTTISSIKVFLAAQGTLASLNLDLSSDPPYSREDIISLLTLGATRSSLENRGGEVSAVGALMVFSGALLGQIEDQARSFTGLQVFQLEPTLSDTGGAARVVLGKQLSDQIFISYSRNLGSEGDEQFSVEYQLLDFLSLVGKQDQDGVYSFDLVFSAGGLPWLRY